MNNALIDDLEVDSNLCHRLKGVPFSGEARAFNESGVVVTIMNFLNGYQHGKSSDFYPNASPQFTQEFDMGSIHGETLEYDSEGRLKRRRIFVRGVVVSDQYL